mmetsp:Transcript_42702/g.128164  ORF Transcript_42702/g.128164 Transcript_42702/m.128164 type:complete len:311 (+) Transcript_42702:1530-2462(+)
MVQRERGRVRWAGDGLERGARVVHNVLAEHVKAGQRACHHRTQVRHEAVLQQRLRSQDQLLGALGAQLHKAAQQWAVRGWRRQYKRCHEAQRQLRLGRQPLVRHHHVEHRLKVAAVHFSEAVDELLLCGRACRRVRLERLLHLQHALQQLHHRAPRKLLTPAHVLPRQRQQRLHHRAQALAIALGRRRHRSLHRVDHLLRREHARWRHDAARGAALLLRRRPRQARMRQHLCALQLVDMRRQHSVDGVHERRRQPTPHDRELVLELQQRQRWAVQALHQLRHHAVHWLHIALDHGAAALERRGEAVVHAC